MRNRALSMACLGFLLAGLFAIGCGGPKAQTQTVTVAATGGVDKAPVNLDSRVADVVVWSNSGDDPITITFLHGGPGAIEVPAHGQSREVAVSEFGGKGSYPYHVSRGGQSMNAAPDTTGGPDEPGVVVGP